MAKQATKGKPAKKTGKGSKEKKQKPNKTSQKQAKKPSKKDKKPREFSDSSSSSSESNSKKSSVVVAGGGGGGGNGQPVVLATAAKERVEMPGAIPNVKHPHGYLPKLIEDERPDLMFTQKLSHLEADCMDKHLKDHAELSPGDVFTIEDKDLYYEYEIRSKYNEGRYSAIYMCFRTVFKNGKSIEDKGIYMMKTSLRRSSTRSPLLIKREAKVLNDLKAKKGKAITVNIIDSGKVCDMPYIVTTLLDRNIDKFRSDVGSLSLSTALFVGLEALTALQELVAKRYVHRDIKPSNLAFGMKGDAMRVFLIDFGDTIKPGKTIKVGVPDGLTLPYWSVDCHKRTRVTYKTDLESWYYTLIDLAQQGCLPWKENRHIDDVQKAKEQFWKGQFSTILNEPKLVSVGELVSSHDGSDTKAHSKMYKMLNDCLTAQLNGAKFVPDWMKKK